MRPQTGLTILALVLLMSLAAPLAPSAHAQSSIPLSYMPTTNGQVLVIVPDGAGGVYIGGQFTQVIPASGPAVTRNRAARINADGSIHSWNPNANGNVKALAVSGSTVYVGGDFTTIGGASRNRIAALDATTGNATGWDPGANSSVEALAVSGDRVYVGGAFTTIGGANPRKYLAVLDTRINTNHDMIWNPNPNGAVSALVLNGGILYVAGDFDHIGGGTGAPRNRLAAFDIASHTLTAWDPNATGSSVKALAVSGSTIYMGGQSLTIGGQPRQAIGAVDTSGAVTAWAPNVTGGGGTVYAIAVSGNVVYAGGSFYNIGGTDHKYLAGIDATSATLTAWNPIPSYDLSALAVSGNTVYMGGTFTTIGGVSRKYFAAFAAPYLSGLLPSAGTLFPAFSSTTYSYSAYVANSVTSITLTPTSPNTDSVIRVNGTIVASGAASGAIALAIGSNAIPVTITAPDNSARTYTITVTRRAASTTTSLTSSPNPSTFGHSVTFTANVTSGGAPVSSGTVAFSDDGTTITGCSAQAVNSSGQAACSTSALPTGSHSIAAEYSGDTDHDASTSNTIVHEITSPPVSQVSVFMPLVSRSEVALQTNLVVSSLTAAANSIEVVIQNTGNMSIADDFWVDLYINPNPAPTRVNQTWPMLSSQGAVWGVTSAGRASLVPGGTLTLSLGDAYYHPALSHLTLPLPAGALVYAQVDSANTSTTYGAVRETHEIDGAAYDNIRSTTVGAGASQFNLKYSGTEPPRGSLPRRP